jgi:hypothetical protein
MLPPTLFPEVASKIGDIPRRVQGVTATFGGLITMWSVGRGGCGGEAGVAQA